MYNSLIILLCVLAVYGAYALFREFLFLFIRKKKMITAIRVQTGFAEDLADAEYFAQTHRLFESRPILLCDTNPPADIHKYGMDVYVLIPRKEVQWERRNL